MFAMFNKKLNKKTRRPHMRGSQRRLKLELLETRRLLAVNAIVAENLLPGSPASEWDIGQGIGDPSIQGFATDISVDQGETIAFKVDNQTLAPYRIDIYRIGYYGGDGARKVATVPSNETLVLAQPDPITDLQTGLVDAGNWSVTATWDVPESATSGVYIARVTREDTGGASHIIFVVRDDDGESDLLFQTSDTTWQAYNTWGGNSFYQGPNNGRAYALSYNRPFDTRQTTAKDWFFSSEFAMVRWIERNGYDVSYFTGVDSDRIGDEILEHDVFLSVGHDEYWSAQQRTNVEAARDAGVSLAFFSGNEVYWKTRWESSLDASGAPYRTLVSYKETWDDAKIDPESEIWTGTWRDDRFSPPADGGNPENALTGQIFTVNRGPGGDTGTPFEVPAEFASMSFWRDTRVADLQPGEVATLGDYVLGYEWDEDLDNGFRPDGLFRMSSTTQAVPAKIDQYGGRVTSPGIATHSLTMYRAESGALVFGAGTVHWAWGLDGTHDVIASTPDSAIQQATVNLFADMGVQPETLQPGLKYASISLDVIAPLSSITSIESDTNFVTGVPVTISGTAADAGGIVAGIEVSTDGGVTWRRAEGRASWSYSWTPDRVGEVVIYSRAVDDSANLELPGSGVEVFVDLAPTSSVGLVAAYSFDESQGSVLNDSSGLGNDGVISGAVFVPGITGNALSFDGINDLVTIADSNSLDLTDGMSLEAWVKPNNLQGWKSVVFKENDSNGIAYALYASDSSFNPPAGYVDVPVGNDSVQATSPLPIDQWSHLTLTYDSQVLRIYINGELARSEVVTGGMTPSNAPLRMGGNAVFGNEFFSGLIDEVRIYNRPLTVGEISYNVSSSVSGSTDSVPPNAELLGFIAGSEVSGVVNLTVLATDNVAVGKVTMLLDGAPLSVDSSLPYETALNTQSLPNGEHSLVVIVNDLVGNTTELSPVSFVVANSPDTIAPTVDLLHPKSTSLVGGSTILAAVAQDNVAVEAVEFFVDGNQVGVADTSMPYRVVWNSSTIADGSYEVMAVSRDAAGNTSSSFVTVNIDNTTPTVVSMLPGIGAVSEQPTVQPQVVLSESIRGTSAVMELRNEAGDLVAASLEYDDSSRRLTLMPTGDLQLDTTYQVTLSGVQDLAGNLAAPVQWSFTVDAFVESATLWNDLDIPAIQSAADTQSVELGVKFRTAVDGFVTGIRFFKGISNTGDHVGKLWDTSGALLGTTSFSNETASGWQQANFAEPIPVTANAVFIASYFAPSGGYAIDSGYFGGTYTNGPLEALASGPNGGNGLYLYGNAGGFPTQSFNSSNYWVDLVFTNAMGDLIAPTVIAQSPGMNQSAVDVDSSITATFSEAVDVSTIAFELRDELNNVVPASFDFDAVTRTATLNPAAPLVEDASYSASISGAADLSGNVMLPFAWAFETAGVIPNASLWSLGDIPAVTSSSDTGAVELGVKFRSDRDGYIRGLRFYKGAGNNGTHVGNLWAADGSLLSSAVFASESAEGWQSVQFALPQFITANTIYVASYFAPNGGYAFNQAYFTTSYSNGILTAPSSGESGGNGVYRYGASSAFPGQNFNAANYWVDVIFSETLDDSTAPEVVAQAPSPDSTGVALDSDIEAILSEAVQPASVQFELRNSGGDLVPAEVTYDIATNRVRLNPTEDLRPLAGYTARLSGATDAVGNTMDTVVWSFTSEGRWRQSSSSDFSTGTLSGLKATSAGGGALQLATNFFDDFDGNSVSSEWGTQIWAANDSVVVVDGVVSVQGSMLFTQAEYIDQTVEGVLIFGASPYQHFGMTTGFDTTAGNYWAMFSTGGTDNLLFARVNVSGVTQDINLGALPTGFHAYEVRPTGSSFEFYVDGVLQTTIAASFPDSTPLKIALSAYRGATSPPLRADAIRLVNVSAPLDANGARVGYFESLSFDAGDIANWKTVAWVAERPANTDVKIEILVSDSPDFDGAVWLEVSNGQDLTALGIQGQYLKYRVTLSTFDELVSPKLFDINFTWF